MTSSSNKRFSKSTLNPRSLVDLLRWRALHQPDKCVYRFLIDGEREEVNTTYRELDLQAKTIGALLQSYGLSGERVLLLYPPGLEYISAFFGCLYAGVVAIPAYPPRRDKSVSKIQAIAGDADAAVALTTTATLSSLQRLFMCSSALSRTRYLTTDSASTETANNWQDPGVSENTLAFLQYTSGSTAAPKGVMLTHGNLLQNSEIIIRKLGISSESRGVFWLPPYHDMGLIGVIIQAIYSDALPTLMSPASFLQRPIRWLQAISRYRATHSGGPNFAYELCTRMITSEQKSNLDLTSWKVAITGAEPIRHDTLERFTEAFEPYGFRREAFYPCYGLAESTLFVMGGETTAPPVVRSFNRSSLERHRVIDRQDNEENSRTLVGCGHAPQQNDVRIVDPQSQIQCPADRVGEIWVSGPSIAKGYWNKPKETEYSFNAYLANTGEGPFLRTGDLGFLKDGELFVTGRLKDLIIIRGTNHYPDDIELTVEKCHPALHPGCGAAISLEIEDEERLIVVQELKRRYRKSNFEEIFGAIRQSVAEQHELQVFSISLLMSGSIPKTSSGKIQRHACRDGFLARTLKVAGEWTQDYKDVTKATAYDHFYPEDRTDSLTKSKDRNAIEEWLVSRISERLRVNPREIDARLPLTRYGLDSKEAIILASEMEDWLGRQLSPALVYEYPTIDALSSFLAGEYIDSASPTPIKRKEKHETQGIAVIGIGCRFPKAKSPEAFWKLLSDGVDAITEVPTSRWDVDEFFDPNPDAPGKMYTRWGGFIEDVDKFDAEFFGIAPREAVNMDPQQRLLLEVSWEALENAFQAPDKLAGSRTGVFIGISTNDYLRLQLKNNDLTDINAYSGTGTADCITSGRLSYILGLQGPNLAIDTACSSSLVAIHLACQSLRNGESDMALAGGVNLILSPDSTIYFCKVRALSADGGCKTFDASADGYVRGEGCGMVVLKRLSDALKNGDNVLAVIRGSAINHDGLSSGLTVPSGLAQQRVIRDALANAGIEDYSQVSYVEAHGTGTSLGDPIEVRAIGEALAQGGADDDPLAIGSVKTNIGHLEAAAGIAGLIKVVLALQNKEIPPHLNLNELNPYISREKLPIAIHTERTPWPSKLDRRIAGVSSFGFSGTNAHVVLEEAPTPPVSDQTKKKEVVQPYILPLSARSAKALEFMVRDYLDLIQNDGSGSQQSLYDICYTASVRRTHHDHRLAFLGHSRSEIGKRMEAYLNQDRQDISTGRKSSGGKCKLAFVFSGHGSHWIGMGRKLLEKEPVFRTTMEYCDSLLSQHASWSILDELNADDAHSRMHHTEVAQPTLFALQLALVELWGSLGIHPQAVVGHSIGEVTAAQVAGVMNLQDAIRVVFHRGRLMQEATGNGRMVSVELTLDEVKQLKDTYNTRLSVAAYNGPKSFVLSGDPSAIDEVIDSLNQQKRFCRDLKVDYAFHCPQMDPFKSRLLDALDELRNQSTALPIYSTVTGTLEDGLGFDSTYWGRNLREPVLFAPAIEEMIRDGYNTFLEISPHPILLGPINQLFSHLGAEGVVLSSLRRFEGEHDTMLSSLGKLYALGQNVNWHNLYPTGGRLVSLPSYKWQRERFWLDISKGRNKQSWQTVQEPKKHHLLGQRINSPIQIHETKLDREEVSDLAGHLRKLAIEAAKEYLGEGKHNFVTFTLAESREFQRGPVSLQTIVSRDPTGLAEVRLYTHPEGQGTWNLEASALMATGDECEHTDVEGDTNNSSRLKPMLTRESLLSEAQENRESLIEEYLKNQIAHVLELDISRLDINKPINNLGLDSLMAIELKNTVQTDLGIEVPITQFLDGPTIATLSIQLLEMITTDVKSSAIPLVPSSEEDGEHPLSYNQQAMWFLDQLVPNDISFNVSGAVRIRGNFDVPTLKRALKKIIHRHPSLRTAFLMSERRPVQILHDHIEIPFYEEDASTWSEDLLQIRLTQNAYKPFDLEKGDVLRVALYRISQQESVLLVSIHHIVSDFWSMTIFAHDLLTLYQMERPGLPSPLPQLKLKFTDYVRWEAETLAGPEGERLWHYWREELAGELPVLNLPTDKPRQPVQTFRGDSCNIEFTRELTDQLKEFSNSKAATLFMTLVAAFQVLLHRYTGQEDILIGSVMAGRNNKELENIIGYFLNPVALRADLTDNPGFTDFLKQVKKKVLGAFEHQAYPPPLLAERLNLERDPSRPPLFQAMFILQKAHMPELHEFSSVPLGIAQGHIEIDGLTIEPMAIGGLPAQFDLTLMVAETEGRLAASLHFNADLYEPTTIDRMLIHLKNLLEGIVSNPKRSVRDYSLLADEEWHRQLIDWNDTKLDYPEGSCIHHLFDIQAKRKPDKFALAFEEGKLTYRELYQRANQLARHLQSLGVEPETPVGIFTERTKEMTIGLLGILKAGGAYVPLDPAYPEDRIAFMLEDARIEIILTQEKLIAKLPGHKARTISLDTDWDRIATKSGNKPKELVNPENLAYVIYTSGSTGKPKGVQIPHRAVANFLHSMQQKPGITELDIMLAVTTLSFDISVLELLLPLTTGAQTIVVTKDMASDGPLLIEKLNNSGATVMQATPATWQMLIDAGWQGDENLKILCGGEALPRGVADELLKRCGTLWNMYGPTETTIWSTIHEVKAGDGAVPIGRPIGNTQVYILDNQLNPVPLGLPGDLYIGGDGIARGYLNRPELTAEKFTPDRFSKNAKARLYKTGDLARYLAGGSIEFLGRSDNQVKVRGFRIEPAEIESALMKHPAVQAAIVVARSTDRNLGDKRLVCYIVILKDRKAPLPSKLRAFLRQKLPEYMIPSTFVILDSLPFTPNGKVNRKLLPAPPKERPESIGDHDLPRSPQESEIAGICAEILDLEKVGINDSFFDLGGTSLQATRLIFQVQKRFKTKVPLVRLFENPTIAGLSKAIDDSRAGIALGNKLAQEGGIFGTITIGELKSDAILEPSIGANGLIYERVEIPEHVFLTGSTGFLGAFLLRDLLHNTMANIYCLVRASNPVEGMSRIENNLKYYSLWEERFRSRIHHVVGELSLPKLGLREEEYQKLASVIDFIYHNGALVNFIYPYHAVKKTNVNGTKEILKLASDRKIKPVHFVSSLAVSLTKEDFRSDIFHEDINHAGIPYGGYAQSKLVAEKLLLTAYERGIPVCIYRPGPITGHSNLGTWNTNDFIVSMLQACITMGTAPELDIMVDFVPVDYVSEAIIHLSFQSKSFGKIFHIAAPRQLHLNEILGHVRSLGFPIKEIPFDEWKEDFFKLAFQNPERDWHAFVPLIDEFEIDRIRVPRFDTQNTIAGLEGTSVVCPQFGRELIRTYINYFTRSGFLNPPPEKGGGSGSHY